MTKRETGSRAHVALRRCEDTERQTPAPEISRSWQRCWNLGLDRRAVPEDAIVSGQELKTTRQAKRLLMRLARLVKMPRPRPQRRPGLTLMRWLRLSLTFGLLAVPPVGSRAWKPMLPSSMPTQRKRRPA